MVSVFHVRGILTLLVFGVVVASGHMGAPCAAQNPEDLMAITADTRPWVYWFWKNGNINRESITADLEAMHAVGIGSMIVMEVSLSVPPGPVSFFSEAWRELFAHAVREADRLGLKIVQANVRLHWNSLKRCMGSTGILRFWPSLRLNQVLA